jgi:hypothetical protein
VGDLLSSALVFGLCFVAAIWSLIVSAVFLTASKKMTLQNSVFTSAAIGILPVIGTILFMIRF